MTKPKPATLADVARQAGVSRQTVSNFLNTREIVAIETAKRVEAAIQALGYRPNRLAQSLRSGGSLFVAMRLENEATASRTDGLMLRSAIAWAAQRQLLVIPYLAPAQVRDEIHALTSLTSAWHIAAVIFADSAPLPKEVEAHLIKGNIQAMLCSSLNGESISESTSEIRLELK